MLHAARLAARAAAPRAIVPAYTGAYIGARTLASKAGKSRAVPPAPKQPPASPASEQPLASNLDGPKPAKGAGTPPPPPAAEDVTPPPATDAPPTLRSLDFTSTLADAALAAPADGTGAAPAGRTGARAAGKSGSSTERRRRTMGRLALGVFGIGLGYVTYELGDEWTVDEVKAKKWTVDEVPLTRWGRTRTRFQDFFNVFTEPQWEELLPPPQPGQKPLTLIVSLDDLLVTSKWDRTHGWRTAKRPGADYFLAYLSQFYEVVIWSTQNHYTALPIVEQLDRYRFFVSYSLFRESTRARPGGVGVVKDLSFLNRDLAKVVVLDTDPDVVSSHPGNALVLPRWDGAPRDAGLVALIPFLESIGIYNPADVRPILDAYRGKDIPREYAATEAAAKAAHIAEHRARRGAGALTLRGLFGASSSSAGAGAAGDAPPTYLEAKRAEAQALYRQEQAYIAEHKDEFEALLAADREAAMGEAPGSLVGFMQAMSGGAPPQAQANAGAPPAAGTQVAVASK